MDPLVAHQRAQDVFSGVLAGVKPGQLDALTPCQEWTVGDLIEHVIGGNERVAIRAGLRSASREHMTGALRGPGNFFREAQPCDQGRPSADQLAASAGAEGCGTASSR